ncbi:MAG: hypothetical protein KKD18_00235 [Nanoarchaeota archaeon]|nr:hypothetical protein [Nanoarchaeota archaeon]
MTNEAQFGLIKTERPKAEPTDLLGVPFRGGRLIVSPRAVGPDTYRNNLARLNGPFSHNSANLRIDSFSFDEPTTAESLATAAYEFETRAKPEVFDPLWLQAGRCVVTRKGVFSNARTTNPEALDELERHSEEHNGILIYQGENPAWQDVAFAPYDTFKQGVQKAGTFLEGGLARALEQAKGRPEALAVISNPEIYDCGVDVWGFAPVEEPVERVVRLYSYWGAYRRRLCVCGGYSLGDDDGYVFGVYRGAAKGSAPKK